MLEDKSRKIKDREEFVKKYKAAVAAGLTIEQFAGYLGMTAPDSVNRRRLTIYETIGLDLPLLKRVSTNKNGKPSKDDEFKKIPPETLKRYQTELGKLTKGDNKLLNNPIAKDDLSSYDGLLVTSAQNATPIHDGFLATALNYCTVNNYKLIIIPYRYKNPTSVFQELEHEYWDPKIVPYLLDNRIKAFKNLQILGHIKKQATAIQPLYGLDAETGLDSAIVGHPKIQLRTIPTPSQTLPKIFTSTGAITLPNYTDSGAGWKGVTHHSYAAAVVEFDRSLDIFHLRHVHADKETGHFYDLDKFYTSNSALKYGRASTLVTGDSHAIFMDPNVEKATYTDSDSLVNLTNPENIVLHDVLDGYSISHHHKNNDVVKIGKHRFKMGNIEDELQITADFIDRISREDTKTYIVKSNHDEHFDRWLQECDPSNDPENAQFYHWMKYHRAKNITQTKTGFQTVDPFIFWCNNPDRQRGLEKKRLVHILKRDESLYINNIELSFHGDKGSNGSRGSAPQFARIGPKVVIGHSHSPQIYESVYQVGLSAYMDLEYKSGCSSWMHAHCLVYPDGKRTMIFLVKARFRSTKKMK